ncbi:DEAD/DEAH box helicase family protein [Apirhabdus apintestini]|nr:DEAD/DEAH box helicase family protein [Enterobacteriaceae bacterium CA-0114]
METGTGKTYCYIKTLFELNQRYGWSKFIVVVPGIAIREGVDKSLRITAAHFAEIYGKKARCFIYNSRQPQALEQFASDAGIHVMIINTQAFNAAGKDNRRIYEALDAFRSRRPIDVLSACRPILILDEPQRMEGKKPLARLPISPHWQFCAIRPPIKLTTIKFIVWTRWTPITKNWLKNRRARHCR